MADWLMQEVGVVDANSLFGGERRVGAIVVRRKEPGVSPPAIIQSAIAPEDARLFDEIAQKSREFEVACQHKSQFIRFSNARRVSREDTMSKRILVVEDQEDLRGVLRDLLSGSGYSVIEAADGG